MNTERRLSSQAGASLVEYALLVGLIAVLAVVAVKTLGESISSQFSKEGSALSG